MAGCAQANGSRNVALQLRESAPPTWQRYTDKWVADANAGRNTYGRYSWNVLGSQPCPSPSPTPTPSPTLPPGVTPTPPRLSLPPGVTLAPGVTLPPAPTLPPGQRR